MFSDQLLLPLIRFDDELLQFLISYLHILDTEQVSFLQIVKVFDQFEGLLEVHLLIVEDFLDLLILSTLLMLLEINIEICFVSIRCLSILIFIDPLLVIPFFQLF